MMDTIKEKFNAIARNSDAYWLLGTRRERFKAAPIRTLKNAAIRRTLQSSIDLGIIKKAVRVKTFWGEKVLIPSRAAYNLMERGFLQGEDFRLTGFIVNTLKEGDVVIDGGASFGWYTLLASGVVGATGKVHSFEPTDRSFAILQANVATHPNVSANHVALWKESGRVQFNDFGFRFDVANTLVQEKERIDYYDKLVTHNADHRVVSVPAVSLDDYCAKNGITPDFIKLDCESAEFEILSGATTILKKHPIIATEVLGATLRSGVGKKLMDLLREYGYAGYAIRDDFSIEPIDPDFMTELSNVIFISGTPASILRKNQ